MLLVSKLGGYMYDYKSKLPKNSFFAAANGYSGFKSIFDSVFDRKISTRTFIIKGGPGTGKSSLMRNLHMGMPVILL